MCDIKTIFFLKNLNVDFWVYNKIASQKSNENNRYVTVLLNQDSKIEEISFFIKAMFKKSKILYYKFPFFNINNIINLYNHIVLYDSSIESSAVALLLKRKNCFSVPVALLTDAFVKNTVMENVYNVSDLVV